MSDKIIFPSKEWVGEFMIKVNENENYAEAAKTWEGDFVFRIEADGTGGLTEDFEMYCDLWHGVCRDAYHITPEKPAPENVEFVYSGKYKNWIKLLNKEIGPIKGLMMRKFKLKGDMAKVMKALKAAQELVQSTTMVDNVEYQ